MHSITGAVRHRVGAGIVCIGLLALGSALAGAGDSPRALGPAPRDADGRFENWTPDLPRAGPSVTFPFFLRRFAARFRDPVGLPPRVEPDVARIRGSGDESLVTWVGHATLLVQMSGVSFLTDPIWSDTAGPGIGGAIRYQAPGLAIDELPPIDFVIVSHNHYDHLDLASLERIARDHPNATFFLPLKNGELLRDKGIENVVELDWGEQRRVGVVTVHCLPSQHGSQRGITDQRKALWSSWAVTSPKRHFYFAGDSGAFEGFGLIGRALGPFDLAAVPIGAYEPQAMMRFVHLDPEQAVAAAMALRARQMMAMHFGTFDLSDEPIDEPPRRFQAAAKAAGVPTDDVWVLELGETRPF